eukprot:8292727-Prorocentrum_lima.AAC.1
MAGKQPGHKAGLIAPKDVPLQTRTVTKILIAIKTERGGAQTSNGMQKHNPTVEMKVARQGRFRREQLRAKVTAERSRGGAQVQIACVAIKKRMAGPPPQRRRRSEEGRHGRRIDDRRCDHTIQVGVPKVGQISPDTLISQRSIRTSPILENQTETASGNDCKEGKEERRRTS